MRLCRDSSGRCARRWKCGFTTSACSMNRATAITWLLRHGVPRWKANEWLLAAETMMMMTMIIITVVSRYDDPAAAMIHERLLAPGSLLPTLSPLLSYSLTLYVLSFSLFLFLSLFPSCHRQCEITNGRWSHTTTELRLSLSQSIIYET